MSYSLRLLMQRLFYIKFLPKAICWSTNVAFSNEYGVFLGPYFKFQKHFQMQVNSGFGVLYVE